MSSVLLLLFKDQAGRSGGRTRRPPTTHGQHQPGSPSKSPHSRWCVLITSMSGNVLWTNLFNKPDSQAQDLTRQRIVQEERCGRRPASIVPGLVYDAMVRGKGPSVPVDPWAPGKGERGALQPPLVGYGGTIPMVRPEQCASSSSRAAMVPAYEFVDGQCQLNARSMPACFESCRQHGRQSRGSCRALCESPWLRGHGQDAPASAGGRGVQPWHEAFRDPGDAHAAWPRPLRQSLHRKSRRSARLISPKHNRPVLLGVVVGLITDILIVCRDRSPQP